MQYSKRIDYKKRNLHMIMKKIFLTFLCLFPLLLNAQGSNSSEFMKGYLTAKLEERYSNAEIEIDVGDEEIIICSWPAGVDGASIKLFVEECCPNFSVQFGSPDSLTEESTVTIIDPAEEKFLPELNSFFPTMLAQPHILGYSVGYRSYDKVFKSSIPVSIGDQFSLLQITSQSYGCLYLGIEACVWAIFDARAKSLSLINADYFVALPFTYMNDEFSARLRVFHESSHLGDEFLIENPQILRKNPSMEVLDLSLAYEPLDGLQLFLGYSTVLRSDEYFKVKSNSFYYGVNCFFDCAKIQILNIEAYPYIAAYFTNQENNNWKLDGSLVIGYQWDKSYGRKLRVYLMSHNGFSAEGQFVKRRSKYISFNIMYGY